MVDVKLANHCKKMVVMYIYTALPQACLCYDIVLVESTILLMSYAWLVRSAIN